MQKNVGDEVIFEDLINILIKYNTPISYYII